MRQEAGAGEVATASRFSLARFPLIGQNSAAWFASFGIHFLLLFVLAVVSLAIPNKPDELSLSYESLDLPEEIDPLSDEFISSENPMEEAGALGQSGDSSALASAVVIDDRSLVLFEPDVITDYGERMVIEVNSPVFQGPEITEDLPVQGAGSVVTTGAMGAIDRITSEILVSVEQQPTLVVWLFDQSGSLRNERTRILRRFRSIYEHLGIIEAAANPAFRKHEDKPLLTAVVSFAEQSQVLTPKPTDRLEEIQAAVAAIKDDESGRENVFRAVAKVAEKYRSYRLARNGRRNVMIVVFTDESGDDVNRADATTDLCRKLAMPVYVVGRPAPFGRPTASVKWIDPDPDYDQRPQWVPVNLGPESLMPERLKLHFLGAGNRDDSLDSGYGPYSLTRLCYETGGLYFSAHPNRTVGRLVSEYRTSELATHFTAFFDPEIMRRYQPEYISTKEYRRRLSKNRARYALVEAAQLSWTSPIGDVRTRFPKRDEASLSEALSRAQRAAAIRQPKVNQLCQVLLAGESARDAIKSPRWQAGYDLAVGRALATKVRNDGYNAILAFAKQGMAFKKEKNNTWVLAADNSFANSSLEKLAKKAEDYLNRVLLEHEGTPWAMLAQRELSSPLGWRWDEDFTYLPPLPGQLAGNGTPPPTPRPTPRPKGPPRRNPPEL
ncbi:MAG: VWA domain-containing protein [Planctomycetes bacterium]|nr:VWA domain-containing protein [Planctomycetota bacterium]